MKKSTLVLSVIVLLALVVGVWALAAVRNPGTNGSSTATTNEANSANGDNSNSGATNNSQAPASGNINITNNMFTPPQINVKVGGTVTWTNNDKVAHTVTADLSNGNGPASGEIQPGQSYSYTFKKAGSVQYHCEIHHSMRGTIVVK